jgi:hypothetical protein
MRELGWNGPKLMKIDGEAKRGYTKEVVSVQRATSGSFEVPG